MSVIPKSSLFVTPASLEDLNDRNQQLPARDQGTAYHFTMLAFNLAHKLVEEQKLKDSIAKATGFGLQNN